MGSSHIGVACFVHVELVITQWRAWLCIFVYNAGEAEKFRSVLKEIDSDSASSVALLQDDTYGLMALKSVLAYIRLRSSSVSEIITKLEETTKFILFIPCFVDNQFATLTQQTHSVFP